jgi:hypothetical protein
MLRSRLSRLALGLAALAGSGGASLAQDLAACQRLRAELASIERQSGPAPARVNGNAVAAQHEIARLSGYYRSIGCERPRFLFFAGPPAECPAIVQRIQMLNQIARTDPGRVSVRAIDPALQARRGQLLAAIAQTCPAGTDPRSANGDSPVGGRKLVCVRSCDGFYFPLHNVPRGANPDEMCRALCPGTEASAFRMSGDDIGGAVSVRGRAYSSLPAAFKYRTKFDASCSCRKPGESWAEALAKAETMLTRFAGDILVTARKAEELSRPKLLKAGVKKPDGKATASAPTAPEAGSPDVSTAREPQVTIMLGSDLPATPPDLTEKPGDTGATASADPPGRNIRVIAPQVTPGPIRTQ